MTWQFDPGIVIPLALAAFLYARGARTSRGVTPLQQVCFWNGCTVLTLALISPLHPLGELLFSAHMAQHEILMLVAAPLLVLSRPLVAFLWGLPFAWRRAIGAWSKTRPVARTWAAITAPFAAWTIHAVALWVWHAPWLFQATLENEWLHAAQHLSFLLSALLFWWALLFQRGRIGYGAGVVYIFTTAIHTSILGALLTFAPRLWYPAYANTAPAWGLTGLEDQQIGGLIMWVPAGIVYTIAGLALFSVWLRESRAPIYPIALVILAFTGLTAGCSQTSARAAAAGVTGGDPQRGLAAISRYGCGSCHTIAGNRSAYGLVGPPLTGIGNRMYVAGVLANTPDNIVRWIRHPKQVNEKTVMPDLGVTQQDATDIAAYLYSTK